MRRPIKPAKRRIQPAHAKRHRGFVYEVVGGICSEKGRMYNIIDIAEWFRRYMAKKQVGISGSIETATWSNGLEDDPWPLMIETLDRIATALERLLKISEMSR